MNIDKNKAKNRYKNYNITSLEEKSMHNNLDGPIPNDYLNDNYKFEEKLFPKKISNSGVDNNIDKDNLKIHKRIEELECLYENALKDKNYEELLSNELINGLKMKIEKYEEDIDLLTKSNNSFRGHLEELQKESELTLIENMELKKEIQIKSQTILILQETLMKNNFNENNEFIGITKNKNLNNIQNKEVCNNNNNSEFMINQNEIFNHYTNTVENSIKELSNKMDNFCKKNMEFIKDRVDTNTNSDKRSTKFKKTSRSNKLISPDKNNLYENDIDVDIDYNNNGELFTNKFKEINFNQEYITELINNNNRFTKTLIDENNILKNKILKMNEIFLKKQYEFDNNGKLFNELKNYENERKNVRLFVKKIIFKLKSFKLDIVKLIEDFYLYKDNFLKKYNKIINNEDDSFDNNSNCSNNSNPEKEIHNQYDEELVFELIKKIGILLKNILKKMSKLEIKA